MTWDNSYCGKTISESWCHWRRCWSSNEENHKKTFPRTPMFSETRCEAIYEINSLKTLIFQAVSLFCMNFLNPLTSLLFSIYKTWLVLFVLGNFVYTNNLARWSVRNYIFEFKTVVYWIHKFIIIFMYKIGRVITCQTHQRDVSSLQKILHQKRVY
jgi:hypothetical protein